MNKNNKFKELTNKKGFYIALYSCAAVIVVIAGIISVNNMNSIKNNQKPNVVADNNPNTVESQTEDSAAVNQSNVKSYLENEQSTTEIPKTSSSENEKNTNEVKPKTNETTKSDDKNTESQTQKTAQSSENNDNKVFSLFDDSKEMSWPVSGKIVMDYSIETAIYDKTLDQYRTNDSICISAPVGTQVKASAEGIVESISKDSESGNSVVINHGNGWLSTYSQLQDNILVKEGALVKEGDVIGGVANPTNYSILMGPHLEFKLTKDEKTTDPKIVLAQLDE